jgi:TetR/AcrR family transcriptional repressor of nem operon
MPRSKEFDRDDALRKAVSAFQESGFEGTSIQVLVDRMGIHRASLYDTYGSKEELYREALTRYEALVHERFRPALDAPGPAWPTLERFFDRVVDELTGAETSQDSCLMLKTALSGARHLGGVPAQVRGHYDWFGRHFERLIARARLEGDVDSPTPDAELAAFLRHVLLGAIAAATVDGDAEGLRRHVRRQLALLTR